MIICCECKNAPCQCSDSNKARIETEQEILEAELALIRAKTEYHQALTKKIQGRL